MKRSITVRAMAISAAAALSIVGLGYGVASASQPDLQANSITQPLGNLHIHKYTPTTSGSTKGDGTQISNPETSLPGAKPIEGITFKVYQIQGLDIHKNQDWQTLQGLSEKFNQAHGVEARKQVLTDASLQIQQQGSDKTTNASGDADFIDLPVAFYYVEEVQPTSNGCKVESQSVDCSKISPVDPFLVSVPMTNPTNHTDWMYDVHVYPKNQITKDNEKSVKDQDAHGSGNSDSKSNIVYTIKTNLPVGTSDYKSYVVVDPLDSKLTYIGDQGSTKDVVKSITDNGQDVEAYTSPTDYSIAKSDPDNRTVTLTFTPTGLQKLIKARDIKKATKLQWDLNARVNTTTGKTEISNIAYQLPSNTPNLKWDSGNKPGNPTNKVVSKYGKVVITKKGVGPDSEHLQGAQFELYTCVEGTPSARPENKVYVGGKSTWTSGINGQIVIDGLRLNDWINDSKAQSGLVSSPTEAYCLKETKAPAGYELLPAVIQFQLLTKTPEYTLNMDVKDAPSNGGFNLPVTGGQGIALLAIAGGLLVAGSVIYSVAATRKRKQNA